MREIIMSRTVKVCIIAIGLLLPLAPGAIAQFTVSGTVTDASMVPVSNVVVKLYLSDGTPAFGFRDTTDAFGAYSITGLWTATFGFGFEPSPASKLLPKMVQGVAVSGNQTLNVTVDAGLWLQGYVTDNVGQGLAGIDLNVYDQSTGNVLNTRGDNSDGSGFYQVVIPPGIFRLLWRDLSGVLLPVEILDDTITVDTSINVTMLTGFTVSGTITDNLSNPVVNANLDFIDNATGISIVVSNDNTDGNGQYSVIIPMGTYDVRVKPLASYKLLYGLVPSVVIASNVQLDFTLQPGISVSGFIRDIFGAGVSGADIDVKDNLTGTKLYTPFDKTNGSGFYDVIVPVGTYRLIYQPPVATMLAPIEIPNVPISIDTVVNPVVPNGMLLTGIVKNSSGVGLFKVDLDALDEVTGLNIPLVDDKTLSDGTFATVLAPGSYQIDFEPIKSTRYAAIRMYGVMLGVDTSMIITVLSGAMISGTVTDSVGSAVADLDVDVIVSSTGDTVFTPADNTDLIGYYEVVVPFGTYDLVYRPDSLSGYADTVTVAGVSIGSDTNVDVVLSPSGPSNQPPVLNPIGSKSTNTEAQLLFSVSSSDPDGTTPVLQTSWLPGGASFTDHNDGTGTFDWTPSVAQAGNYSITFYASDGQAIDSEIVSITVSSGGGNQAPVLAVGGARATDIGVLLAFDISATDPDGTIPQLFVGTLPTGAGFVDNLDGTGTFTWTPDVSQGGVYAIEFFAFDGLLSDTETVPITVLVGPGCCVGVRGDIDYVGAGTGIDVSDLTFMVGFLFRGGAQPPCTDEGDINGSGGPTPIDVADLTFVVGYLFRGGPGPGACP